MKAEEWDDWGLFPQRLHLPPAYLLPSPHIFAERHRATSPDCTDEGTEAESQGNFGLPAQGLSPSDHLKLLNQIRMVEAGWEGEGRGAVELRKPHGFPF